MRRPRCLLSSAFAALLGALSSALLAAPASGLLDASEVGLRDDLAWLADRRRIDLGTTTWPMPVSLVTAALAAAKTQDMSEADRDALARIRDALAKLDEAAVASWHINTARQPVTDAGLAIRARNEASVQLQVASPSSAMRLRLGLQDERLAVSPSRAVIDGSYIATQWHDTVVSLGAVDRWWGPARYASPILGNAAPPIVTLGLRRSVESAPETPLLAWVGPWNYELSVGRPGHYTPRGANVIGIRLTARPWPGVELGASRYIYWGGVGRLNSFSSLRDALLGHSNIDNPAPMPDPSNEVAGIDLRWSLPTAKATWVAYGHFAGEDEANGMPSQWIATIGVQRKVADERRRIEWTAEASDTRLGHLFGLRPENLTPAYEHGTFVAGHYQHGLPVGAFIGGGGVVATLGVAVVPLSDATAPRWEARIWRAKVSELGNEPINAAFGRPGTINGLSLQAAGQARPLRWHVGLAVQHRRGGAESGRRNIGLIGGRDLPLREP